MGHGIYTDRDFQISEDIAWHGLTIVKPCEKTDFPVISAQQIFTEKGDPIVCAGKPWFVPVSEDDGETCGEPFSTESYTLFTPHEAWEYVEKVLSGTQYTIESIGMLFGRTRWFISAHLDELEKMSIAGRETKFKLNFSGGA